MHSTKLKTKTPNMENKMACLILILIIGPYAFCQSDNFLPKGLEISFSTNLETNKESRFSFRKRTEIGFNTSLKYHWGGIQNKQSIDVSFGKNFRSLKNNLVIFNFLKPTIVYTFQRKVNNFFLGGFADIGALLAFPRGWTGDNAIAYTLWTSLGVSAEYYKAISSKKESAFFLKLRFPLISYVVRPAYGFPYPEKFIRDGTFDFQRQNMGKYILTSGKITSLHKFQNILFDLGYLLHITKKRHQVGLTYTLEYLRYNEVRDVMQFRNGIKLFSIFKF
jgi:hypothetical protein